MAVEFMRHVCALSLLLPEYELLHNSSFKKDGFHGTVASTSAERDVVTPEIITFTTK